MNFTVPLPLSLVATIFFFRQTLPEKKNSFSPFCFFSKKILYSSLSFRVHGFMIYSSPPKKNQSRSPSSLTSLSLSLSPFFFFFVFPLPSGFSFLFLDSSPSPFLSFLVLPLFPLLPYFLSIFPSSLRFFFSFPSSCWIPLLPSLRLLLLPPLRLILKKASHFPCFKH